MYVGMLVYRMVFDRYHTYTEKGYTPAWVPNEDALWQVTRIVGNYAKVMRIHAYSEVTAWARIERIHAVPDHQMARAIRTVQRAIEYKVSAELEEAKRKAVADAAALSQNTVTRALVHAADNGYCNETVIALVSAGHKMPEGTVSIRMTVDVPVEIDGKEDYYIMRAIFGATRGNLSKLVGMNIPSSEGYTSIESKVSEKLAQVGIETSWRDWQNASIVGSDIQFPRPTIRPIEEVQQAPAAHYSE